MAQPIPIDPILFLPKSWDDICGCHQVKRHFRELISAVRVKKQRSGWNTLLAGVSRSGKTSITRFTIDALTCQKFHPESLAPCGTCETCQARIHAFPQSRGYEVFDVFRYFHVDCASLTSGELDSILDFTCRDHTNLVTIVYLDEIHHLAKGLDQRLLKPLEDDRAIWIGTSAYLASDDRPDKVKSLDQMVLNRFPDKLVTTLPSVEELYGFLFDRCLESQIKVEDPSRPLKENELHPTLVRLAEKCGRIPGRGLQVLSKAFKRGGLLTTQMVENHIFDFDEA